MEREDPRNSLLALCVKGINWSMLAREAQRPGGIAGLLTGKITEQSTDAVSALPVLRATLEDFEIHLDHAIAEVRKAEDSGAHLVTVLDEHYPANLKLISNLPPFLFYRGELRDDDARAVAVVGTREASEEGLKRASTVARGLAGAGVTVLSGLAKGIDTAAHKATLEAGGRTIAVIGTGILRCYPKENQGLADAIADRGAVVSQFWPESNPSRYSFPLRNVVMSGMGQGTVVIEATQTSGAKMQARLALEHGKRVFLVRTLVTSQSWAKKYVKTRSAIEVASIDEIVVHLRSPKDIRTLSDRRQLMLDLA